MLNAHSRFARPAGPRFPGHGRSLVTPTRQGAISVARFTAKDASDGVTITMPQEDAFVIIYQLIEHPAYDFWLDGKFQPADPAPRASTFAIPLAGKPKAEMDRPVDKLIFHLPRATLDEIAEDTGSAPIPELRAPNGWETYDSIVEQLEGVILLALAEDRPDNSLFYDHIMLGIGLHFAQSYGGLRVPIVPVRGGLASWQEKRAKEILAENLARDISLQEIAAECGLSLAHFSRAFKASTGTSPHKWLQKQRLARARDLLRSSDMTLADISLACGFADQSHFTRSFAHLAGTTPGRWRRAAA